LREDIGDYVVSSKQLYYNPEELKGHPHCFEFKKITWRSEDNNKAAAIHSTLLELF
jgi:hypothetical protein